MRRLGLATGLRRKKYKNQRLVRDRGGFVPFQGKGSLMFIELSCSLPSANLTISLDLPAPGFHDEPRQSTEKDNCSVFASLACRRSARFYVSKPVKRSSKNGLVDRGMAYFRGLLCWPRLPASLYIVTVDPLDRVRICCSLLVMTGKKRPIWSRILIVSA